MKFSQSAMAALLSLFLVNLVSVAFAQEDHAHPRSKPETAEDKYRLRLRTVNYTKTFRWVQTDASENTLIKIASTSKMDWAPRNIALRNPSINVNPRERSMQLTGIVEIDGVTSLFSQTADYTRNRYPGGDFLLLAHFTLSSKKDRGQACGYSESREISVVVFTDEEGEKLHFGTLKADYDSTEDSCHHTSSEQQSIEYALSSEK
jgi:hypothetical protein